ncbi:MAG: hypothetical protein M9896_18970 [Candidatus Promineofilum sp.]|uniref:hypothetical protein n=1 Tax=Promineifilum sp. TaxID=2664178 RepID=UPI001D91C7AD|nr:hypothetical protein [Caldilineaceae bacterium]MCB9137755.1 hypothetical protein [Caldilineaceae bacterium]MCO5182126.1 hypothetical protein [Promineifilum sp.]
MSDTPRKARYTIAAILGLLRPQVASRITQDLFEHISVEELMALRLLVGADITIDDKNEYVVEFLDNNEEKPTELIQLTVSFVSNLWAATSLQDKSSPRLEQIFEHARQICNLGASMPDPEAWEAAHNVRLTLAIQRALRTERPANHFKTTHVRVFLVSSNATVKLIPQYDRPFGKEMSSMAALMLYEAVAYRLSRFDLSVLVNALDELARQAEAGAITLRSHGQVALAAVDAGIAKSMSSL